MTLREALIGAIEGATIRQRTWEKDVCVRIVAGQTDRGRRLRIVRTNSTKIPVYEPLESLDAEAIDWEFVDPSNKGN